MNETRDDAHVFSLALDFPACPVHLPAPELILRVMRRATLPARWRQFARGVYRVSLERSFKLTLGAEWRVMGCSARLSA